MASGTGRLDRGVSADSKRYDSPLLPGVAGTSAWWISPHFYSTRPNRLYLRAAHPPRAAAQTANRPWCERAGRLDAPGPAHAETLQTPLPLRETRVRTRGPRHR